MKSSNIYKSTIIGTAQLGSNYGIANKENKINLNDKIDFLNFSYQNKFTSIDTAYAYPNSHKIIGKWIKSTQAKPIITSKIPNLENYKNINIETLFNRILKTLNVDKLNCLLMHNPNDWFDNNIKKSVEKMINNNLISVFGLSIYEKKHIPDYDLVKVLQVPGNIFNQKLLLTDELNKFLDSGGTVQIRSVFVQGLILMDIANIPNKFDEIKNGLNHFDNIARELNIDKAYLAIQCIKFLIPNSKIVIGFDNIKQLDSIIKLSNKKIKESDLKEILKIGKKYDNSLWDTRIW